MVATVPGTDAVVETSCRPPAVAPAESTGPVAFILTTAAQLLGVAENVVPSVENVTVQP